MTEKKETAQKLRFHSANKIDKYNGAGEGGEKEKKNPKESTEQVKTIINVFLESLPSESFPPCWESGPPHYPRRPSNTVLISGPAVGAAQILIWSYSCVFLPPMSTAIRTSAFSFVGALNDLLYIP